MLPLALAGMLSVPSAVCAQHALSLEERVACREKVEDVYWAHRIWPKENPTAKPARSAVMSHEQIAQRVEESLRYEAALEAIWSKPLTPEVIQAEMDRQAKNTRDPAMLRDLWAALDNDPYLIAECLVRPELAERRLESWYANDRGLHAPTRERAERELAAAKGIDDLRSGTGEITAAEWTKATTAPGEGKARPGRAGGLVLTLSAEEWEELRGGLLQEFSAQGGASRPHHGLALRNLPSSSLDHRPEKIPVGRLSPLREDDERFYSRVIELQSPSGIQGTTVSWPKQSFAQWWLTARGSVTAHHSNLAGGSVQPSFTLTIPRSDGCIDDTWQIPSTLVLPARRYYHTAVWTGSEMIVWGGIDYRSMNSGGRYSPVTDTWVATSLAGAPSPRHIHSAVWTGSEMIVWGGFGADDLGDGGRYTPETDTWAAINGVGAPAGRAGHSAVWTGKEMIVWGGSGSNSSFRSGGRYTPATDSWAGTSLAGAPTGRFYSTVVWTGSEMIVWGGQICIAFSCDFPDAGGKYNPETDSWSVPTTATGPRGRYLHTAVWTGTEMIIWGGESNSGFLNDGWRYRPASDSWSATSTSMAPTARSAHVAVWTGSEMIVWGGAGETAGGGGRYTPGTDRWVATNDASAPGGRDSSTAVWTGTEMIVWGGYGGGSSLNDGGRYSPASDRWLPTYRPPTGRWLHVAVWTGSEMIVWGGSDASGHQYPSSGGRYVPGTDTWVATSTEQAPKGRVFSAAVWTGTEMIVWGGFDYPSVNTGGRYTPETDAWVPTNTATAPAARSGHSAIWTGTEMIVWGGGDDSRRIFFSDGARYTPGTNTWVPTNISGAPAPRAEHSAVWTGREMIIWGGNDVDEEDDTRALSTGGRYTPATDSWLATSTTNALSARTEHTAVWTGSEMIVWGGSYALYTYLGDGARYAPGTDSWLSISATNAPASRVLHTALWTGSEMIVWGGLGENYTRLNSGGRYHPASDAWETTSATTAPPPRDAHTAVWTGTEMIVWGGDPGPVSDGGLYCAARIPLAACHPNAATLCLDDQPGDGRFEVKVHYQTDQAGGLSGEGQAIPLAAHHAGVFSFFSADNPELLIRLIDGCAINNRFWIFTSGATNAGFNVTVRDARSGVVRVYFKPDRLPGSPILDTAGLDCAAGSGESVLLGSGTEGREWKSAPRPTSPPSLELFPDSSSRASEVCVPDSTTLCVGNRFRIRTAYQTRQSGGLEGPARALPLSSPGSARGGLFSFFSADNPEMLVKVIDGCALNGHFWVFYGAGTNVGFRVTVADLLTGASKTYFSQDLTPAALVQDTAAFPCG